MPNHNFCLGFRYPSKIIDWIKMPIIDALIYKVDLLIFTENEMIVKRIGSIFSTDGLDDNNIYKDYFRIKKSDIKSFSIEKRTTISPQISYWLKIKISNRKRSLIFLIFENTTIPSSNIQFLIKSNFCGLRS